MVNLCQLLIFFSPRVHEVDIPAISVSDARKARDLTAEFNSARCIYFRGKTVRGTKFRGLIVSLYLYACMAFYYFVSCACLIQANPFSFARLISSSLIFILACNVLRR